MPQDTTTNSSRILQKDSPSRCASVISTTSITGQFCQVKINNQAVIVPKEYLSVDKKGQMSCAMSGVNFPVSSCVDVNLEQGPPKEDSSDSPSEVSLLVPSSCSSDSSLALEEDKVYTVSTQGKKYKLQGKDIIRGSNDDDFYYIRVNGTLVEVSDLEEEEEEAGDVSNYSTAPGNSDNQGLQQADTYSVVFNGQTVNLPGSMLFPTDIPGSYVASVDGQTGLVTNPVPLSGVPNDNISPFTNTDFSPFTDTTFSSRNSTPMAGYLPMQQALSNSTVNQATTQQSINNLTSAPKPVFIPTQQAMNTPRTNSNPVLFSSQQQLNNPKPATNSALFLTQQTKSTVNSVPFLIQQQANNPTVTSVPNSAFVPPQQQYSYPTANLIPNSVPFATQGQPNIPIVPNPTSEVFQVEGIIQDRMGSPLSNSPQPNFPNVSVQTCVTNKIQEVPSMVTQMLNDALERKHPDEFEILERHESPVRPSAVAQHLSTRSVSLSPLVQVHPIPTPKRKKKSQSLTPQERSPSPMMNAESPKPHRRSPRTARPLTPKQQIIKEQLEKAEYIAATAPRPRKPKFVSPLTFLPQVVQSQRTRIQSRVEEQEISSNVLITVSTPSEGSGQTPDISLPALPGIEEMFSKFLTVEEIHHEAWQEDKPEEEPESTPRPSSPFEVVEDNVLVQLPGIADLNDRLNAEFEVESRLQMTTREDFSSTDESSSDPDHIYDKVVQLSQLPGLETLDVMVRQHEENMEKNEMVQELEQSDPEEAEEVIKLINLPGLDSLMEEVDRPKGLYGETESEETDTALFQSTSIFQQNTRNRGVSGSSLNTLQQIDDIVSLNSSIKENNMCLPARTPSSQVLSPDIPRIDFFRVLIEGTWYTARSNDLTEQNREVYMTMIDGTVRKVERFVKVPGVGSPSSTNIYLCDSKSYAVYHKNTVFTVLGTAIQPSTHDFDMFDVTLNGEIISVKPENIVEKETTRTEFGTLKSMVAVKLEGVWKVIPSSKIAPSAKMVGQYYVRRNGKVTFFTPSDVYPLFKPTDLPLGSNDIPQNYVVKLRGRNVKVPIGSFSVSRSQNDSVIIHHKSSKHTVKLASLVPFVDNTSSTDPMSVTHTSSFSAPEYKDNLYCVNVGSKSVNIAGRNIKPHKSKQGYCKMRYRGKIYRVKSTKIKLTRQTATSLNSEVGAQQAATKTESNTVQQEEQVQQCSNVVQQFDTQAMISKPVSKVPAQQKHKASVRFPNFSQILKSVPDVEPPDQHATTFQSEYVNTTVQQQSKQHFVTRGQEKILPKVVVSQHPPTGQHPKINHPITLDVKPSRNLKIVQKKKKSSNQTAIHFPTIRKELTTHRQFEISNIRRSPTPTHRQFQISNIRSSPTPAPAKQFEISNIQSSPLHIPPLSAQRPSGHHVPAAKIQSCSAATTLQRSAGPINHAMITADQTNISSISREKVSQHTEATGQFTQKSGGASFTVPPVLTVPPVQKTCTVPGIESVDFKCAYQNDVSLNCSGISEVHGGLGGKNLLNVSGQLKKAKHHRGGIISSPNCVADIELPVL